MAEHTGSSRCPVKHQGDSSSTSSAWTRFWSSTLPEDAPSAASLEEAAKHAQTPQPDQTIPLATNRQVSSIPRGDEAHHQHGSSDNNNWVYPSEQQFYNAMRRKGWTNIPEDSIPTVLQIHNHINERTWRQIQEWEGSNNIVLTKFQGRPTDLSPKAFLLSKLLRVRDTPFDRHDWYVQNGNSTGPQRYVIDYYYLPPKDPRLPPIPYIDARPALDQPRGFFLRTQRFIQDAFPGITALWKKE